MPYASLSDTWLSKQTNTFDLLLDHWGHVAHIVGVEIVDDHLSEVLVFQDGHLKIKLSNYKQKSGKD